LFKLPIFPEPLQFSPIAKNKLLGIVVFWVKGGAVYYGSTFYRLAAQHHTLKDDNVPVWGQNAATWSGTVQV